MSSDTKSNASIIIGGMFVGFLLLSMSSIIASMTRQTPPASTPTSTPTPTSSVSPPPATVKPTKYCYKYSNAPMRTLVYQSNDCNKALPGWEYIDPNLKSVGGEFMAYDSPTPGTEQYCIYDETTPQRSILVKSDKCDKGKSIYFPSGKIDGSEQMCYRYADNPLRMLLYKSSDCAPKWGWGANTSYGSGGVIHALK